MALTREARFQFTSPVAARSILRTESIERTQDLTVEQNLQPDMTRIAEKVRPGEPNGSGIVPLVLAEIRARTPLPLSVANYSDETVRLYRVHDAAGPSW